MGHGGIKVIRLRRLVTLAVVALIGACGAAKPVATSVKPAQSTTSTVDPFAPPAKIFMASDTKILVNAGTTFGIYLPQDPKAGSWSFSQKPGPVELLSGGSMDNDDATRTQTFSFRATQPGGEELTFTYSGGRPPATPSSITFAITVV
jgi:predicted secreted protein